MHGISAMANAAPRFGFYEPRAMVGFMHNFMILADGKDGSARSVSKPFVVLALNNSFSLPQQWVLSLDFSYNGAGSGGYIEYSQTASLNFAVLKYFFNRTLKVSLKAIDLLNTSTARIHGAFQGVQISGYSWMDTRSVRLNVVYYFNKHKTVKQHSSIASEVNRL